jgi:Zn-dependent M28 family amino/carboxypeptidase
VLARWPGRGPLAREVVLIGGHYDHFGIGAPVDGDSIYNGAEDNASGTAGVLATAEAFVRSGVRTSRSVVFAGFAAEESGLLGSQALVRGAYFRSDHFSLARAGVPGTSIESGSDFVGRPAGWGKQQQDLYVAKRYHQPSDELLPWFTFDGAMQQLRVTVRTAVSIGDASQPPAWNPGSEFREAGEARRGAK